MIKKSNKQKDKKEKEKEKTETEKTNKQKIRARSTNLRLTALFSPCNNHSLSKLLRLKWQVAQSFYQARSHDLFWKGVGPPKKQWTFWTKKLFELTFLGP